MTHLIGYLCETESKLKLYLRVKTVPKKQSFLVSFCSKWAVKTALIKPNSSTSRTIGKSRKCDMFKRDVLVVIILMTFLSVLAINLERLRIIFNLGQSYRKWDLQTSREHERTMISTGPAAKTQEKYPSLLCRKTILKMSVSEYRIVGD